MSAIQTCSIKRSVTPIRAQKFNPYLHTCCSGVPFGPSRLRISSVNSRSKLLTYDVMREPDMAAARRLA